MASNMNDAWTSIEKLKGNENYHTWSFAVRFWNLYGLKRCIISGENAEKDPEKNQENKSSHYVSPFIYTHIQSATTAKELWTKLKDMFEDSSLVKRIGLLRKLITIRLETSSSINDYVMQITETANKLNWISGRRRMLGSILLAGLTDEYKPLILDLESSRIPIQADTVKSKLIDVAINTSKDSAFFGKRNTKYNKRGKFLKNSNQNFKCYNCGKKGRIANKCCIKSNSTEHKHRPIEEKRKSADDKNKSTKDAKSTLTENVFNAVYLTRNPRREKWYIDSGASQHMTLFNDLIVKESDTNVEEIITANAEKMSISGAEVIVNVEDCKIGIKNVPTFSKSAFGCSEMKNGNQIVFDQEGCKIFNKAKECIVTVKLIDYTEPVRPDIYKGKS